MIGGIVLAAGTSSRFGADNKLLQEWNGKPLVRHVVDAALASRLDRVVVVTGHDRYGVEAVLPQSCHTIHNFEYAGGMAGSIRAGHYRLQGYMPVLILLGDMPLVTANHINAMIDAFEQAGSQAAIVVATDNGRMGNPVLFGRDHFRSLKLLEGDRGARSLIDENAVIKVEIGEAAARDFDTRQAFARD